MRPFALASALKFLLSTSIMPLGSTAIELVHGFVETSCEVCFRGEVVSAKP